MRDSWKALAQHQWTRTIAEIRLHDRAVVLAARIGKAASRPVQRQFTTSIQAGICTHEEVRSALSAAVRIPAIAGCVTGWMSTKMRALIVDEVFDANELDLLFVEMAVRAGVNVTLIGDPWQALYGFRGRHRMRFPVSLLGPE